MNTKRFPSKIQHASRAVFALIFCFLLITTVAFPLLFAVQARAENPSEEKGVLGKAGDALHSALSWFGGVITGAQSEMAASIWIVLLYIIQTILSAVLVIVAFLLDNLFYYNVVLNPQYMPAVKEGWIIMRDAANSFFLIIVLWIAFTIIFDLESLGGKNLLARLVVVAIFLNFSLVFVSAIFGFTNQLALPFRRAIQDSNLAAFIMQRTKLQSALGPPDSPAAVQRFRDDFAAKKQDCGFNALLESSDAAVVADGISGKAGCVGGTAALEFADSFSRGFEASTGILGLTKHAIRMALTVIFLALLIVSLLAASLMLIGRIVAMVFLSVLAPMAFTCKIIPSKSAEGLWDKWLRVLLCWAFYAPAFYFLLYMSLKILDALTKAPLINDAATGAIGNLLMAIPFIVFLVFLWVAITLGKKLGCQGADVIMDIGKKVGGLALGVGGAVATGGASLAAKGAMAAARPALTSMLAGTGEGADHKAGLIEKISARPLLGKLAAPFTRRAEDWVQQQKGEVAKSQEQGERLPRELALARAQSTFNRRERLGYAMAYLKNGGDIGTLQKTMPMEQLMDTAGRLGMQRQLMDIRPDLAPGADDDQRAANTQRHASIMRGGRIGEMNTEALRRQDAMGNAVRTGLWMNINFSPHILQQIAQKDIQAGRLLVDQLGNMENELAEMEHRGDGQSDEAKSLRAALENAQQKFESFFQGSPAASVGLSEPPQWTQKRQQAARQQEQAQEEERRRREETEGSFG